jgi:hypothetical protein
VSFRLRPWQLAALVIVLCAAVVAAVFYYRHRGGTSASDLVSYLPAEDALIGWVDVRAIQASGMLDVLGQTRVVEEADYRDFVEQTGFNYRDDLQAFGFSLRSDPASHERDVFAVAHGSFDWKKIFRYAKAHGAECAQAFCHVAGSHPGRYLSFYPLRSDLIALAVSSDPYGALLVGRRPGAKPLPVPAQPVWLIASAQALRSKELLPDGTHAFASALDGADRVTFSLGPGADDLELGMQAACRNPDDATALLVRLEQTTETLRKWIAREHQTANPADLSGVLAAGSFRRDGRTVVGSWPIRRAFLQAVAGGSAR